MIENGVVTSSDQIDAFRITREQVTDPRYDYSGRATSEMSDEDVGDVGSGPA